MWNEETCPVYLEARHKRFVVHHTFGSSNVQGCVAVGVLDVKIARGIDEGLCSCQVAVGSSIVEPCAAVLGLDVQVAACLYELLNHLQPKQDVSACMAKQS